MDLSRIKNRFISRIITRFPSLGDRFLRSYSPFESGDIPWIPLTKQLSRAAVALITTAGVHHRDQTPFNMIDRNGDSSYRVIDARRPVSDLMITHDYYDHRDADRDINIVFPIDRLREFEQEGIIGRVAEFHYSFMGHITGPHIKTLTGETAPETARQLSRAKVDLAVLTPG